VTTTASSSKTSLAKTNERKNAVVNNTVDALEWLREQLDGDGDDLLREMVREFGQRLMAAEVDAVVGVGWGEHRQAVSEGAHRFREAGREG